MSKGACEAHSGCLAHVFISCLYFVRLDFAPSEHFCGKFNPECDGLKMHSEMSCRPYEVHSGRFGTHFCFVPIFHTCGVYSFRSNPLLRKVLHCLGRIRNACQNYRGSIRSPFGWSGTYFYFAPIYRTSGVCGSHWDPFCRKVKHRLGWIQKSRQNEQGTIRSPLGWLALFFIL